MKRMVLNIIFFLSESITILFVFIVSIFVRKNRKKIIFGTSPILSNKYWANALKQAGYDAETLMATYYKINEKSDYDKYYDDLVPKILRHKHIVKLAALFFVMLYIIKTAKIVVMPFHGMIFRKFFWRIELLLLKLYGIKVIVLPYGSDAYMYSRVRNKSLQNALLSSYPEMARNEKLIEKKVFFYSKYADLIITGFMGIDGMPRWDITLPQFFHIDTSLWKAKDNYSMNNGYNGVVKILHAPNHRDFKGTEFLINAVEELKAEGLKVELILLEKVPNWKVRETMQKVDILAEQFIAIGYALNGIEGMASGLPVLANLDDETYTEIFRRYSFLNECPILSTSPETLKNNLKLLITNPKLRKELGILGRKYVEKYHSYEAARYLFSNIFKKLDGEDIDLKNLFHPLKSVYVKQNYIHTPLVKNKFIGKVHT